MRKLVTVIVAIALVVGGALIFTKLKNSKKVRKPKNTNVLQTAFVKRVENKTIPILVKESGRLVAKNRLEVFAEVQGVMEITSKEFKPGTAFTKGETMVKIFSEDYKARLSAQKSSLQNLITSILPDLRLDYPEAYKRWSAYLSNFDVNQTISVLPETKSEKEKYFVTSRNIYTTFYNTKNMELVFDKYTLNAPYSGILANAMVTPGTLVRPGQRLGEFIDPSVYEMEIAVSKSLLPYLKVGEEVEVSDREDSSIKTTGKVLRINGRVNQTTQTVDVFIEVKGENLKEGMFLEASIKGREIDNSFEVSRGLLIDGKKLFVVRDDVLHLLPANIVYSTKNTVVVSGLTEGEQLVVRNVAGAYDGMKVKVSKN